MIDRNPPVLGALWYLFSIIALLTSVALDSAKIFPVSLCLLIFVYYGTHEAIHNTLWPTNWQKHKLTGALTFWLNCVGFALIGHNFLLLRWSHSQHHTHGRDELDHTIDGKAASGGREGKLMYYAGLAGWSFWYHIGLGFLYLFPSNWNIVDCRFKPLRHGKWLYAIIQVQTALLFGAIVVLTDGYYLLLMLVFGVFWGSLQNVAHYGLEIGESKVSVFASRTYRLPRLIEVACFRGGFYHLEHHLFPRVPGLKLNQADVSATIIQRYGFEPIIHVGLLRYLSHVFEQYRGPIADRTRISGSWYKGVGGRDGEASQNS